MVSGKAPFGYYETVYAQLPIRQTLSQPGSSLGFTVYPKRRPGAVAQRGYKALPPWEKEYSAWDVFKDALAGIKDISIGSPYRTTTQQEHYYEKPEISSMEDVKYTAEKAVEKAVEDVKEALTPDGVGDAWEDFSNSAKWLGIGAGVSLAALGIIMVIKK